MKYCSQCGKLIERRVPEGDDLPRYVCPSCRHIHYQNPKIVVGCLPEWKDKILMCRRAIEPRKGLWTLPAGFMENDETTLEGATRETLEEANAQVTDHQLYVLFNLPHINQVYLLFRAQLRDLEFSPGAESLDVQLYDEASIPWEEIAFPVIRETLLLYFDDRARGAYRIHCGDIIRLPGQDFQFKTCNLKSN
jgi:ADP-ribose pyrophosphatase YjhB (NUDIX family)